MTIRLVVIFYVRFSLSLPNVEVLLHDYQYCLLGAGVLFWRRVEGATGGGASIIAIPIISLLYDVPTAVAAFTIPNFLSNVWQSWKFRSHQITGMFAGRLRALACLGQQLGQPD